MEAEGPDGHVFEFPDGTDPTVVSRVIREHYAEYRARSAPDYQSARQEVIRREQPRSPVSRNPIVRGVNEFVEQIPRNLGVADEISGGVEYLRQGAINLGRQATGQPIETPASVAYQAAADRENEQRESYARRYPARNVASIASGAALFTPQLRTVAATATAPATTSAVVTPISAPRAAAVSGALNAPFALARQEGSLTERVPGAARETAIVAATGGILQGGSNLLTRNAPRDAARAQQFAQAGVRPTMAAIGGPGNRAGLTKAISENFVAGGSARRHLAESIDDTRDAASRLAGQYGNPASREIVGDQVREGVDRFSNNARLAPPPGAVSARSTSARDWSFAAKADALYDDAFSVVDDAEQAFLGQRGGPIGIQSGTSRVNPVTVAEARRTADDILSRVHQERIAELVRDPDVIAVLNAIRGNTQGIRFSDLRELRTHVRQLQRKPMLRQGVDDAGLQRLEQALTQDIYESAQGLARFHPQGTDATHALRRTDMFYRAGIQRINNALKPFAPIQRGGGGSGASAYRGIVERASSGGRENLAALVSLKRSLRPDEWRTVAASILDELGAPRPGSPVALEAGAFSVDNFVTNYARMTPEGRRALFGGLGGGGQAADDLAAQLDNLAQVAMMQKQVESMRNSSRTAVNLQNAGAVFAGGAALANPSLIPPFLGGIAAMSLTGEMLTNPAFVRWLASAPRAGRATGGWDVHVRQLASLASRDPALAPFYSDLVRDLEPLSARPASTQAQPPQGRQGLPATRYSGLETGEGRQGSPGQPSGAFGDAASVRADGQIPITSAAPGTIVFPSGDGRWIAIAIGSMGADNAIREWAAGRLEPIGAFATEAEAQQAASESPIDPTRPMLDNEDGSFSTEETITVESDGRFFVIPTIVQGRRVDPETAVGLWRAGGNPEVGVAASQEEADAMARGRSERIGNVRGQSRTPAFAQ